METKSRVTLVNTPTNCLAMTACALHERAKGVYYRPDVVITLGEPVHSAFGVLKRALVERIIDIFPRTHVFDYHERTAQKYAVLWSELAAGVDEVWAVRNYRLEAELLHTIAHHKAICFGDSFGCFEEITGPGYRSFDEARLMIPYQFEKTFYEGQPKRAQEDVPYEIVPLRYLRAAIDMFLLRHQDIEVKLKEADKALKERVLLLVSSNYWGGLSPGPEDECELHMQALALHRKSSETVVLKRHPGPDHKTFDLLIERLIQEKVPHHVLSPADVFSNLPVEIICAVIDCPKVIDPLGSSASINLKLLYGSEVCTLIEGRRKPFPTPFELHWHYAFQVILERCREWKGSKPLFSWADIPDDPSLFAVDSEEVERITCSLAQRILAKIEAGDLDTSDYMLRYLRRISPASTDVRMVSAVHYLCCGDTRHAAEELRRVLAVDAENDAAKTLLEQCNAAPEPAAHQGDACSSDVLPAS